MITNYCQPIPPTQLRETFWACPRCGTRRVHIMSSKDGILCLGPNCGFAPFEWVPGRTAPAVRVIPPPLKPKLGVFKGGEPIMFEYYARRYGRQESCATEVTLQTVASHIETRLAARISLLEGRMPTPAEVASFGALAVWPNGQREYRWRDKCILVVRPPDAANRCVVEDVGL